MPSRRHELLARVVPRLRKSRDLDDRATERARLERWHATLDRTFPTGVVPFFARRYAVVREDLPAGFPSYTLTARRQSPRRTVVYLHGGGFVGPIDPFQVRYAARLATTLRARVVVPDYPLTPEHTWRDAHGPLVEQVQRLLEKGDDVTLVGDSAGGGLALAVALTVRDGGGPQPSRLLLISPWVDLTTSTPETFEVTKERPVAVHRQDAGVRRVVGRLARGARPARGLAGARRPERPAAGADVLRHPRLAGAGRPAADPPRAEAGWDLTSVEEPDLIHVYPILPFLPEAARAWRTTTEFLR